jgi:uncharacterized PurR-regulated membrane protein YhhQ (DUF165 family)|tara:strand:- start:952 stop:1194 length:243 start_codon:yes stop_codon:yes gene_type:complete
MEEPLLVLINQKTNYYSDVIIDRLFVDTLIFFFLAFAGTGLPWASWAAGDFCAKLLMIGLLLYPFRLLVCWYPQPLQTTP